MRKIAGFKSRLRYQTTMKKIIRMIDPPNGWAYGFPKAIPDDIPDLEGALLDWMIEEGYPEKDRNVLKYCRFWHKEVEDKIIEDSK